MKYSIKDRAEFEFKSAFIIPEDGKLYIENALLKSEDAANDRGADVYIPKMLLTMEDMRIDSGTLLGLEYISVRDGKKHSTKERKLYKSELIPVAKKLFAQPSDIISVKLSPSERGFELKTRLNFAGEGERELYDLVISCRGLCFEWDEFGETVTRKKSSLKERAKALSREVPAVMLSAADPRTPLKAKLIAAAAVAYALSPIDLIPDFIPLLGQLDDLIIIAGLLGLAVKLIPAEVLEENRKKAAENHYKPKKRAVYGVPVVMIWILVLAGVIMAVMK